MKPHQRALSVLWTLLGTLGARPVHASEGGCPAISLEADDDVRQRSADLLYRIRSELAGRADIDRCARVRLGLEDGGDIEISVTLPDGRAASRRVAEPEDVLPALEGVLLLPEPALPAAPRVPARPPPRVEWTGRSDRDVPATPAPAVRNLGFELSALTGARIGDGQYGLGAGALSSVEVKSWLVGFEGRADGYQPTGGGDLVTALELGALAGKRLYLGGVALDLVAGPAVVMTGIGPGETRTAPANGTGATGATAPPPRSQPGPVPRLLVGARVNLGPRSLFRTFVGIDGELGPRGEAPPEGPSPVPARLPAYTVGLAVGATVGTR